MATQKKVVRKRAYQKKKEAPKFNLIDCPWCGPKGKPVILDQPWGARSMCKVCQCEGPLAKDIKDLYSAEEAWNSR